MKKLKNNRGLTLIEMLVSVAIIAILSLAMSTTMGSGMRIYRTSTFEADSSALTGILNNALGDVLRYTDTVTMNTDSGFRDSAGTLHVKDDVNFLFTSYDYGIRDGYFLDPSEDIMNVHNTLQMLNKNDDSVMYLVNTGAYPDLEISAFQIEYLPLYNDDPTGSLENNFFKVNYTISSKSDSTKTRDVSCVIRRMIPAEPIPRPV